MNSTVIIFMIIGMGVVTYIPRMLPFLLFKGKELPPFVQEILKNVPPATLGALIFPAVFYIHDNIFYGIVGAASAFLLAFFDANVIIVVVGAIITLSMYSFLL